MKTRLACVVLIVLSMGLFAVAQDTANNRSSAGAFSGNADGPLVTYKAVKTAAPYGTANYMPLWTGLNTISNSVLYQAGLNVGIGTTSPTATLDVNGKINAATSFNLGGTPFAFGSYALGNVFLGFAGNASTTGYGGNTASGLDALQSVTTGFYNTASGVQALQLNTTGIYNTASGFDALQFNATGNYNTATGFQALVSNTGDSSGDGSGNTATGNWALQYNTTGNYNTALGYYAGPDSKSPNLTNATAIGAFAVVSQSNSLVLGNAAVNVGIHTATPSNVFTIGQGAGPALADGWATYSSRRWKSNIHTLDGALAKVEQLRGVSYDLKSNGKHEVGVIAEEVGAVVPEVVTWETDGQNAQSVDYGRLTALLIEATKEQQVLIHKQQEQIRAQQAQINQQQTLVSKLTSELRTIQVTLKSTRRGATEVRTVKADETTVRQ